MLTNDPQTDTPDMLTEKQRHVYKNYLSNPQYSGICLYGSGRSGKTFLECDYVLDRAIAYPGSFHLFIRATMTALTGGVVSQTFPNLFKAREKLSGINILEAKGDNGKPFIKHLATPHNKFVLHNGSEIRFIGLDTVSTNKAATDKILSQEYLTIIFEEGTEIDYEVVEKTMTRLAQKVKHYRTGNYGKPKWMVSLNPRTFEDWDYIYFHEHKNPKSKELLKYPEETAVVHFHINDNLDNVAEEYLKFLDGLSPMQKQRFLDGQHGDNFEGEIFKQLFWEDLPPIDEFESIIIYTDPSYKSGSKNDYKASMVIGKRRGAFWVIDGRAMKCTTTQMIINVHDLYAIVQAMGWEKPIACWFENAGMPDDFEKAVQEHAEQTGWVCPYRYDNRQKGDKFARIESALVPLNTNGKLFFNRMMKTDMIGSLTNAQFLNFKRHLLPNEHDDIPDAVHGGVTIINVPTLKPGGVKQMNRTSNITF
jgi:phage terminase large subunit-like protein